MTPAAPAPPLSAAFALRLATLAERIAKLHAQIGLSILPERSRRALLEAFADFDATLQRAVEARPGSEIHDNYLLLGMLWREYRDVAARPANRETARKLRERCEEVVWIASKGARLIQESARDNQNAWALRAAQAALLSQRIPKLYLWSRWDMADDAARKELRESEENLARALAALRDAPGLAPEAMTALHSAESQLRFMTDAARELQQGRAVARQLEFIAKTGDHILESAERLRGGFEPG